MHAAQELRCRQMEDTRSYRIADDDVHFRGVSTWGGRGHLHGIFETCVDCRVARGFRTTLQRGCFAAFPCYLVDFPQLVYAAGTRASDCSRYPSIRGGTAYSFCQFLGSILDVCRGGFFCHMDRAGAAGHNHPDVDLASGSGYIPYPSCPNHRRVRMKELERK